MENIEAETDNAQIYVMHKKSLVKYCQMDQKELEKTILSRKKIKRKICELLCDDQNKMLLTN